jgi:hypothetical protein
MLNITPARLREAALGASNTGRWLDTFDIGAALDGGEFDSEGRPLAPPDGYYDEQEADDPHYTRFAGDAEPPIVWPEDVTDPAARADLRLYEGRWLRPACFEPYTLTEQTECLQNVARDLQTAADTIERLQEALRRLLDCPDLNLGNLEDESQDAIDAARLLVPE